MIHLAPAEDTMKKGKESFAKGMALLKKGDLMEAEAEFESARAYFDARQPHERAAETSMLRDETRGWIAYTKACRALQFGREAEDGGEGQVAAGSYRKAYNLFMQSAESFTSLGKTKEADRSRGYMHMANGLNYSSEGDGAFENDEFTKSIELYQKALLHLNQSADRFEAVGDRENGDEVAKMAAQTNADVWISEGHYNLQLSKQTGDDELLAKSEYERTAAESFRKAVEYIEKIGDEELLNNARPSISFAEALHKVSMARYQTHMAEERFTEADYAGAVALFDEATKGLDIASSLYERMTGFVPDDQKAEQSSQIDSMRKLNTAMKALSLGFDHLWKDETDKAMSSFSEAARHFGALDMADQKYRCLKYEAIAKVWKGKTRDDQGIAALAFSSMQVGHLRIHMARQAEGEAEEDWNEAKLFHQLARNSAPKPAEERKQEEIPTDEGHLDIYSRGNREKSVQGFDFAKHMYRRATREFSDAARLFSKVSHPMAKDAELAKATSQASSYLAQAKYFRRRAEGDAANAMESRETLDKAAELIGAAKARMEGFEALAINKQIADEGGVVTLMRNYLASMQSLNAAKKLEEEGHLSDAAVKYEEAAKYIAESLELIESTSSGEGFPVQPQDLKVAHSMYTAYAHNSMAKHLEGEAEKAKAGGNPALEVKYIRRAAEEYKKAAEALNVASGMTTDEGLNQYSEQVYESYLRANSRANLLEGKTGVY